MHDIHSRWTRRAFGAALAACGASWAVATRGQQDVTATEWPARPLGAPQSLAQVHMDAQGALYGLARTGTLWRLAASGWQRVGEGLDPGAPLASGFGRVVGRAAAHGGLWALGTDTGRQARQAPGTVLSAHAGLVVLAAGVIAVAVGDDEAHRVVRLEDTQGQWREVARQSEPVLPDARPVQFDPTGSGSDEQGHIAVLAGPDDVRYRHGVLGDAVEATVLLYLERHSLQPLGRLVLPHPHVLEDIAPRPVAWGAGRALLTVRAGPSGAQLALVTFGPGQAGALAALGTPIGTALRWMSPVTDGQRLMAVHTPHIGGVLHRYRRDGDALSSDVVSAGVSNHVLGRRDLDVSAWLRQHLVVPAQDRRTLWVIQPDARGADALRARVPLLAPVAALRAWQRLGVNGVVALLDDGSLWWATP